jgi:hypothetical protein
MTRTWKSRLIAALQRRTNNPFVARLLILLMRFKSGQITETEDQAAGNHDSRPTPTGEVVSFKDSKITGNVNIGDVAGRDMAKLDIYIEALYIDGEHTNHLVQLLEEQSRLPVDYDSWRVEQNQWLDRCFRSAAESHAHLGQILNVAEEGIRLIERAAIWQQLDIWFQGWKDTHLAIAIRGEEGDGKTWAVASWVQRSMAQRAQFPAVVFLSSAEIQANEPLDILTHAVAQRSLVKPPQLAKRNIGRWLESTALDMPLVLLVLDGINERQAVEWWRELLEKLNIQPWANTVAVLITCRSDYWQRHFGHLRSLKTTTCLLAPYNDHELDTALAAHNLQHSDIPATLLPLARKPRYFDLLIQHRERLAKSGDPTFARLIYEDWRDRMQRKRKIGLDDNAFQNLLRDLAGKHRAGEQSIRDRELTALLPFPNPEVVEELRTSGVFRERNGKFEVQEHYLILAFALLLVDEIEEAVHAGRDVDETIAEWLEPHPAMDIKAHICETAALHALQSDNVPSYARVALLLAWMKSQNIGADAETTIRAYFPIDRQSYFELAEIIWSDRVDYSWGQRILMHTFLHWSTREHQTQTTVWQQRYERWLGLVHRFGYPHQREKDDEKALAVYQAITERLGFELPPDGFSVAGYQLTAIDDDGLLRLGRVALALISHIPRAPYIRALATGCIAEAIMDYPMKYDEFAWIIRTSPQLIWHTVQAEVERLLKVNNRIVQQAAYRLLSFIGNAEAYQLQQALPNDLFPRRPLTDLIEANPCHPIFSSWRREDCERCMSRTDIPTGQLARQIMPYCVDPLFCVSEDINKRLIRLAEAMDVQSMHMGITSTSGDTVYQTCEPALSAYAPEALADTVRRLVCDITVREGMPLRQLALHLREYSLLFTQAEQSAIYQAWSRIQETGDIPDETLKITEIFVFPEILKQLDGQAQLSHLLIRPENVHDRDIFEEYFQPLTDWDEAWERLAAATNVKIITRILWFVSVNAKIVRQQDVVKHILPLLTHEQSIVRAMVLRIIFAAQAQSGRLAVIRGSWSWQSSLSDNENRWGSLILCEYGSELPFSDIAYRVHPLYLGHAVNRRGCRPEEVAAYAEMLHQQWLRQDTETPDLPADFPSIYLESFAVNDDVTHLHRRGLANNQPSQTAAFYSMGASWGGELGTDLPDFQDMMDGNFEQRQQESFDRVNATIQQQAAAGNQWFAHRFFPDALDCVLHIRPDLVDQWVTNMLKEQPEAVHRLHVSSTFFEALCEMLLQTEPQLGLRLYWRLQSISLYVFTRDSNSHIRWLDYALFRAPATVDVQQAWEQRLEQCKTDQELLEVVLVAQAGQKEDWLWFYIERALQSEIPIMHMRAITVLGFIDATLSIERLDQLQTQVPDTWIRKLISLSVERQQQNAWAKHWFRRFLTAHDELYAWASFRLFLRCADRRFWLWQLQVIAEIGSHTISNPRHSFLKANIDVIESQAKKNENDLTKQLFGHKVQGGQLWPWM